MSWGGSLVEFESYTDVAEFARTRRKRKLGHNTYLTEFDIGEHTIYAVRFHYTDVAVYRPGTVSLFTGGWRTSTTKMRINCYLPSGSWNAAGGWLGLRASVWCQLGEWYLSVTGSGEGVAARETRTYDWNEGITLHESGRVTLAHGNPEPAPIADPDGDKRAYGRAAYRRQKAARIAREEHAPELRRQRAELAERNRAAREAAAVVSHADKMAELERRIGTVLAEFNPALPLYRMGD